MVDARLPDGSRRDAINRLAKEMDPSGSESGEWSTAIRDGMSDLRFADANRVPFPFAKVMREKFNLCTVAASSKGSRLTDLDGNETLDVSGSYGVNVAGYDRYKEWLEKGWQRTKALSPCVLGPLHPIVKDNITLLKKVSGQEEVSFHMSGTEAVMAAVRLVRFNKQRDKIVVFNGAYHGWWDGVQPGLGCERDIDDVITLKDMCKSSLKAIKRRKGEIAGVLINPVQSFHPNSPPPNDAVLLTSEIRKTDSSNESYASWLKALRELCDECDIPLMFDEVYSGFRLAPGGAQAYYDIQADIVMYGKTLGGGMPVGVVCGKRDLMRRFDPSHPMRLAYVVGTFSAHPLTTGAMNEFLNWVTEPDTKELYHRVEQDCAAWTQATNARFDALNLPLKVSNLGSIWTIEFKQPGRYNWLLQYYVRAQGINLSWVGTGRCAMSLDMTTDDFNEITEKLVTAAIQMKQDKWWLSAEEQPNRDKLMKSRLTRELLESIVPIPKALQNFYAEIMRRKHDDHVASHSHPTNQFFHLLSSTTFIICYVLVFFEPVIAMWAGLISLLVRQAGHALIEPPCHDKEQLLLGFDTRSKTFIVAGFLLIPIANFVNATNVTWESFYATIAHNIAFHWYIFTTLVIASRVFTIIFKHGFYNSMVWFIKLITDPFTDITAYHRSLLKPV